MPKSSEDRIYDIIGKVPGLTTSDIGSKLGLSRNTTMKYLAIMEAKGIIYHRIVGPSNLWFLPQVRLRELTEKAHYSLETLESVVLELLSQDKKFPLDIDEIKRMKRRIERYKLKH